jgi:hypothetical protein
MFSYYHRTCQFSWWPEYLSQLASNFSELGLSKCALIREGLALWMNMQKDFNYSIIELAVRYCMEKWQTWCEMTSKIIEHHSYQMLLWKPKRPWLYLLKQYFLVSPNWAKKVKYIIQIDTTSNLNQNMANHWQC